MSKRHLPVRPDLDQLKRQAKELLAAVQHRDPSALEEWSEHVGSAVDPADAKLAKAQFALAKSYGLVSWPRLVLSCKLIDAIWNNDVEALRALVMKHPKLIHEMARGGKTCNWGPPMSYAANLGRDEIIRLLHGLGAKDHAYAIDMVHAS